MKNIYRNQYLPGGWYQQTDVKRQAGKNNYFVPQTCMAEPEKISSIVHNNARL
jgi:hypothetical protein